MDSMEPVGWGWPPVCALHAHAAERESMTWQLKAGNIIALHAGCP